MNVHQLWSGYATSTGTRVLLEQ